MRFLKIAMVVGLILALVGMRFAASLLYGVDSLDPGVTVAAIVAMTADYTWARQIGPRAVWFNRKIRDPTEHSLFLAGQSFGYVQRVVTNSPIGVELGVVGDADLRVEALFAHACQELVSQLFYLVRDSLAAGIGLGDHLGLPNLVRL